MNGLKPEMREVVNMCKPVDLDEMISSTYQMEDSVLYKVVCRERQAEKKDSFKTASTKSYASSKSSSGWTFKPQQPKQNETGGQKPQLHLTEAHIAEKKRLGLCFTCDDKWSRQHVCPNRALQVLTVINGIEMEILDQSLIEVEEEVEDTEASMMELSLNSFLGLSSSRTTKLRGVMKATSL